MSCSADELRFLYPQLQKIDPKEWASQWASLYDGYDEQDYWSLINKDGLLTASDFELMGRWKDNAPKESDRWKANVATVAYDVWIEAANHPPKCPSDEDVADFLRSWSERKYRSGKSGQKSFGLARATTLLHFISAGRFPIFDSRVVEAIGWLLGIEPSNTVASYLVCCPLLEQLAAVCGTSDAAGRRKLDKALFAFGKWMADNAHLFRCALGRRRRKR